MKGWYCLCRDTNSQSKHPPKAPLPSSQREHSAKTLYPLIYEILMRTPLLFKTFQCIGLRPFVWPQCLVLRKRYVGRAAQCRHYHLR